MTRTIKTAIAAIALAAAFAPSAFAQAAFAEPGREQVSINIAYGDLDLTSQQGGMTLLGRIEGAARTICRDQAHEAKPEEFNAYKCRRRTVETAVRTLNVDTLTLAWSGKAQPTLLAAR